ncbi:hypothetical protein N657DRAFT_161099 [Parathielavia appendiculata]|uniref:Uncharacterized protein n=1 Tax=Parathielavia appendiculata TaxID=2587402 RepID=A0AAN6YZW3_9PEZI|nr:hypothetical protein N657DRAFT_161099 [Parathielavia appendiculata]
MACSPPMTSAFIYVLYSVQPLTTASRDDMLAPSCEALGRLCHCPELGKFGVLDLSGPSQRCKQTRPLIGKSSMPVGPLLVLIGFGVPPTPPSRHPRSRKVDLSDHLPRSLSTEADEVR